MINHILLDIEGTTSSIDFVHKTLFPFARSRLGNFILENKGDSAVNDLVTACLKTMKEEGGVVESPTNYQQAIDTFIHWIDIDRKHPALKSLQGMIWAKGFRTGEYSAHFYPDVLPMMQKWRNRRINISIYSSGSVQAQKDLFMYSIYGDLSTYIHSYFDTAVGGKREKSSYEVISKNLDLPASEILFLSDIELELDAARAAGMKTAQLFRENGERISKHATAENFNDVVL